MHCNIFNSLSVFSIPLFFFPSFNFFFYFVFPFFAQQRHLLLTPQNLMLEFELCLADWVGIKNRFSNTYKKPASIDYRVINNNVQKKKNQCSILVESVCLDSCCMMKWIFFEIVINEKIVGIVFVNVCSEIKKGVQKYMYHNGLNLCKREILW